MLSLKDYHCPICGKQATKKAKNSFMLCPTHGWLDSGIRLIEIGHAKQDNIQVVDFLITPKQNKKRREV